MTKSITRLMHLVRLANITIPQAKQAAMIALKANAKLLILGHYSTRYGGLEGFKSEAETVFSDVLLAEDGKTFTF